MAKEINLVLDKEDEGVLDKGNERVLDKRGEGVLDKGGKGVKSAEKKQKRRTGVILRQKLPGKVYYVESENDDSVMVGINVVAEKVRNKHGQYVRVRWFDTLQERMMTAVRFFEADGIWGFERDAEEGGGEYFFRPMTLEIYNEKVKGRTKGKFEFDDEEELIQEFLNTVNFVE